MKYPRLYRLLKRQGHTAAKAIEILVDAKRGNDHALAWVRTIFKMRRGR